MERDDSLKQILAVVKPFLAQKVLDSLPAELLDAVQIREVKGYGRQKSYLDRYGESEFSEAFLPKVEITLWVEDEHADQIVQTDLDGRADGADWRWQDHDRRCGKRDVKSSASEREFELLRELSSARSTIHSQETLSDSVRM